MQPLQPAHLYGTCIQPCTNHKHWPATQVVCTTTDAAVMLPFVGLHNNPNVSTASFNPKVDFEAIRENARSARSKPNPAVEILKMVG